MNLVEHRAKALLREAGISTPRGSVTSRPDEAAQAASTLGPVMVKAQVPVGGRGVAGGVIPADHPPQAAAAATSLLGRRFDRHPVSQVLVEERVPVYRELYAAVLNHPPTRSTRVVFSLYGGVDIEETSRSRPRMVRHLDVDPRTSLDLSTSSRLVSEAGSQGPLPEIATTLVRMHELYRRIDAELIEINPLAVSRKGKVVALDCKLRVDPAALPRQPSIAPLSAPEPLTDLERAARQADLHLVELGGDIGVLANGAGLTMTTMDVIAHLGGRPANFLEIGGHAYTRARPALELLVTTPRIRSLVVNFCGAFARTDVMIDGLTRAWLDLRPQVPTFFTVHGTGADRARHLLDERLGIAPYPTMDRAIAAAIAAARIEP